MINFNFFLLNVSFNTIINAFFAFDIHESMQVLIPTL